MGSTELPFIPLEYGITFWFHDYCHGGLGDASQPDT